MGLNKTTTGVEVPVYDILRPSSLNNTTVANVTFVGSPDGKDRYFYGFNNGVFLRYDTYTDTWSSITSPTISTATLPAMTYSSQGFVMYVDSATSNTINIATNSRKNIIGKTIRITNGLGKNQERKIISISDPKVRAYYPNLSMPGIAGAAAITGEIQILSHGGFADIPTLIGWYTFGQSAYNYYQGMTLKVSNCIGLVGNANSNNQNFVRPILAVGNSAVVGSTGFYGRPADRLRGPASGYSRPNSGCKSSTVEYTTATLDRPWDIIPNSTSSYEILDTRTMFFIAPYNTPFTFLSYDNVVQGFYYNMATCGRVGQITTDYAIETTFESETPSVSSLITNATRNQFTDTTTVCAAEIYRNYLVKITNGKGEGQIRSILSAGYGVYQITEPWDIIPDNTSTYTILNPNREVFMIGNGESRLYRYDMNFDTWFLTSNILDHGWSKTIMYTLTEYLDIPITPKWYPITSRLNLPFDLLFTGTLPQPFKINIDEYPTTTGFIGNQVRVGVVLSGYDESIYSNLVGVLCARDWNPIQFTLDSSFNPTRNFTNRPNVSSNTTTVLYDYEKKWIPNQWAGQLLMVNNFANPNVSTDSNRSIQVIASNTVDSISCVNSFGFTPQIGARYFILPIDRIIGRDRTEGDFLNKRAYGRISIPITSATVLTDSSKNWQTNIYAGKRLAIIAGTGQGTEVAISSNTANTITVGTAVTLDTSSVYVILPNYPATTGCNLKYISNSSKDKGRYLYYHRGGTNPMFEMRYDICTETWDIPTYDAPLLTAGGAGTCSVYDYKDRIYFNTGNNSRIISYIDVTDSTVGGAGQYPYASNNSGATGLKHMGLVNRDGQKYIYFARGGNNTDFYRMNIPTEY